MKDMPLKKIRNFGGKLGAELQALGCSTAGEVLALPPATLHQHFGERAPWILYTVQGNSDEPVQVSTRSCHISMLLRTPACLFCVRQGGSSSVSSSRMCCDIPHGSCVGQLQLSTQIKSYCITGVSCTHTFPGVSYTCVVAKQSQ